MGKRRVFGWLARGGLWLLGVPALVLAVDVRDPLVLALRPVMLPALAALSIFAIAVIARGRPGRLLAGLWLLVPLVAVTQEARLGLAKRDVVAAPPAEIAELGRHLVVGYRTLDEVLEPARTGRIGGLFLTRRNIRDRTVADLAVEIAMLQGLRHDAGLPPLIVTTDQEGGIVSHLSPPLTAMPPLAEIGALPERERWDAAFTYGQAQGRELAAVGVTLNLAPVLDLRESKPLNPFDRYSQIGRRAISDDPAVVGALGTAYVAGLASVGVAATAKHFPGLGRIHEDTHFFSARLETPLAELAARDWLPFRTVLNHPAAALMIGHVTVDAIDPDRPAGRSRAVIDGLVRRAWGFDGPIITDDLAMGPAYHAGRCTAAIDGLNAGIDLLLMAYDPTQLYPLLSCLHGARTAGRLDPAMLIKSASRLGGQ